MGAPRAPAAVLEVWRRAPPAAAARTSGALAHAGPDWVGGPADDMGAPRAAAARTSGALAHAGPDWVGGPADDMGAPRAAATGRRHVFIVARATAGPMWCNYCKRPTQIRRGYSLAIMITLLVLFIIPAIIYYFICDRQCQICKGTDISERPPPKQDGAGTGQ